MRASAHCAYWATASRAYAVDKVACGAWSEDRAVQRARSGPGGIEKPVHGGKGLSVGGQDIRAKATSAGETAVQPESDEERNPHHREVRQVAFGVRHEMQVGIWT